MGDAIAMLTVTSAEPYRQRMLDYTKREETDKDNGDWLRPINLIWLLSTFLQRAVDVKLTTRISVVEAR